MGANATGKTSFGQMLMSVFNFIHKKETAYLINRICDVKKEANFSIDFVMNRFTLYSMQIIIHPVNDDDYTENNIEVKIDKIKINKNDSYESCKKRMESKNNLSEYTANYGCLFHHKKKKNLNFQKEILKNLYYSFRKDIKSIRSFHRKSRRTKRY